MASHTTLLEKYVPYPNSLPVKDLCYIDQIAHEQWKKARGEKIKQQQRILWKLKVDSYCDI